MFANAALLVSGLTSVAVAAAAWRNRPTGGTVPLAGFALSVAVWSVAHLLEHASQGALDVLFERVMWTGITPAAFLFLAAVLEYVNREEVLAGRRRVAYYLWPAAVVALLWVPEGTPLAIWSAFDAETGLLYWGHLGVSYALLAVGSTLLLAHTAASRVPFRSQGLAVLVGIVAAWLGSVVGAFELFGSLHLHALPIGLVVLGVCLLWAVVQADLFALAPIARDSVIDRLSAGVVALDRADRVTRINPAARRLLAADGDAVGRDATDVFASTPDLVAWIEATEGRDENRHTTVASADRTLDVELSPLRDDRDRFVGRVLLLHDVTEQRRRQVKLEQQNERLERLTSIISHDLRNPLNVAIGRLELVRDERDSDDLRTVARSHARMAELIEDLLALARQDGDLDREVVALATAARRSWETVETADAGLVVETDASVAADQGRLGQLLENLFRNAVEHGGRDVTVRVGDTDDGFYVADDGAGIDVDDASKLFESGYSTNHDGTGLGLTIVKEVAAAHDWTVDVVDGSDGAVDPSADDEASPDDGDRADPDPVPDERNDLDVRELDVSSGARFEFGNVDRK